MTVVCTLAELVPGRPHLVKSDGREIVLVREGEEVFALDDICSHAEVSLSDGEVAHGAIECWLHGSRFDLRTGQPSGPPANEPVATYPTTITTDADGQLVVAITA